MKKVSIITFSPTGGTLKCATELAATMGEIIQSIDLTDSDLAELMVSNEAVGFSYNNNIEMLRKWTDYSH